MQQTAFFDESISLARLEAHLWEAANILRGSPIEVFRLAVSMRLGWNSL